MYLPLIDVVHRQDDLTKAATAFEIAQLHCLRSIAVSLECIVAIATSENKIMDDDTKSSILFKLNSHSVTKGEPQDG